MENDKSWDFNAPQFVDFTGPVVLEDDDKADAYFDYDHENGIPVAFGDDSVNDKSCNDPFCTPQSEVKKVTRQNTFKTPSDPDTPTSLAPQRVLRSNTPSEATNKLVIKSENNASPALPIKQESEGAKIQTPSPRITRSGKILTPNTVEKSYAEKQVKKTGGNVCTNLEEWRKKTSGAKSSQNSVKTNPSTSEKNEPEMKPTVKRQHRSMDRSNSFNKRQKAAETGTPGKQTKSSSLQRSFSVRENKRPEIRPRNHSRGLSVERPGAQRPRSASKGSISSEPDKPRGITIPTTPTLLKRKPVKIINQPKVKSTEEMELEKIAFYRQQLANKRKLAQESCKTALSSKGPSLQVQHKVLTKPEGFKFETDSRIKGHPETRQESDNKDFARILRSDSGKQPSSTTKCGLTKPEPFNFGQRKRKMTDLDEKQAEKYETMAERLANFTKTPERFRSRPKGGPSEEKRGRSRSPPHVTVPKTPQFETRTRSRPVTAPSRDDMERKEVEEIQRHQFKAHPVNHKIFENACTGIKKVPVKPLTVPEEFHLSGKNKGPEKEHEKEEHYEFHAQPLNKKIFEGPVGIKEPKKGHITVPQSPAFALKHRARLAVVEEPKDDKPVLRSRAVPHFGMPFQPQTSHKKTEPEPFGFEERERKKAEEKRRKMEQILEEEKRQREFHANPLPDNELHLPPKKNRPLTVQQPFNLDTDARGAKKAEEWSKKMEEELHHQKEMARFRAKDAHVLEKEPFIPSKENKCTTADISEFEFNTAKRMVKRDAYETHKKAKQDEYDNILKQEQRMREAEEKAELERIRREAVHKANPVKHYKGVAVRPSDRPLTQPQSPRFKTDTRLRTRAMHGESFMSS